MDPSSDARSKPTCGSDATIETKAPAKDDAHSGGVLEDVLNGSEWQAKDLVERVQENLVGASPAVSSTVPPPRRSHAALPKRVDALDLACERAANVQVALTEFVNKLADVGDASEEKISLLLETLDAGADTRKDLQRMIAEAARQTQRFDQDAAQHDIHVSELARTTIRRIEDSVREQIGQVTDCRAENAARLDETLRTHVSRLESSVGDCRSQLAAVADQHVRDIHREHETRAQDIRKLEEAAREKGSRLSSLVDDGLRRVDAACRAHGSEIDSTVQACIGRLTETSATFATDLSGKLSACLAEIAKHEESSHERERRIGGAAQTCETRLTELAESVSSDLHGKLDDCTADAARHAAEVRRHSDELGDLSARCTESVRKAAERTIDEVRTRHTAVEQLAEQQAEQLTDIGNRQVQRIEEATEQSIASIKQAVRTEMAKLTKAAAVQLERFGPNGEDSARLREVIERTAATVDAETDGQIAKLVAAGEQASVRLSETVDAKGGQLDSQLQAASEAVRMVSNSTRGAHSILDQLIEHREHFEVQVKNLDVESTRATVAADTLAGVYEKVAPKLTAVQECLEGSDATINKIERLIEDVWTVTTTAQKRAQQLTERCNDATATGMKIEGAGKRLEQFAERLTELNAVAGDHVGRLDGAEQLTLRLIERIEGSCDQASHSAETAQQAAQSADAASDRLDSAVSDGAKSAEKLEKSLESTQGLSERFDEQNSAAEAMIERLSGEGEGAPALVNQLRSGIERAERVSQDVEETLAVGSKIKQQLDESTHRANEVSRDAAQMLATLIERRDVLEASDRALGEFLERAEQLHARLQQLQTRGDAFNHQLNGMLADPQRIIDEAKTQAGQLDGVCRAVRKVFSGLSQASLQANRDITRFANVSREANTKLTQLSSETQRSGQTLREWVDEAVHAQARLSKTLAQVPPLSQTHPTAALEDLATSSAAATADILRPPTQRRSFDTAAKTASKLTERGPGSDFGALIRDAKRIAEPQKTAPAAQTTPVEAGRS